MADALRATALFVATDLDSFETSEPQLYGNDVTISDRCYRRLDATYYAWLRAQVARAKQALDAGRLSAATFDAIRVAFNAVHAWAVRHVGETALLAAARTFDAVCYAAPCVDEDVVPRTRCRSTARPRPSDFAFPSAGTWAFTEPVAADTIAKVEAIREEALALGWTERGLLQNRGNLRFPVGGEYGLVCFIDERATVVEITRESIAIDHGRGCVLRFPNPDVTQPWVRRVEASRP